jgi:uncharacterized membrane protein YbhN (UPF0104 family)
MKRILEVLYTPVKIVALKRLQNIFALLCMLLYIAFFWVLVEEPYTSLTTVMIAAAVLSATLILAFLTIHTESLIKEKRKEEWKEWQKKLLSKKSRYREGLIARLEFLLRVLKEERVGSDHIAFADLYKYSKLYFNQDDIVTKRRDSKDNRKEQEEK